MIDYPHITDALRSVVLMTTRGYTHGVSFEAPAERVPAIADKWAEVYGTQLPAWKRHQRKSKGLPVAWACSMPVPGQPARRRLVLLCAGLDASKLDARSPWLREHWLPIERLELGDYIVARDKRDRGDWAWTVRLTPRCMRGTEALYRSLAAQSLEQLRYQIERDVRYHPLFGGVRRQMRRLVRGYAKLWSKRTGKPWPGPDPEKLPALGAFTRTRTGKPKPDATP